MAKPSLAVEGANDGRASIPPGSRWLIRGVVTVVVAALAACGGGVDGGGVGGGGDPGAVAPSVTTQPQAQEVIAPAAATFTAAASGVPTPTSQWQVSTDGGVTFTDVAGATAVSYTTSATSTADSGKRYRVVFTNSAGSATSNAVTLSVRLPSGLALLAGSLGGPGSLDGTGAAARFNAPYSAAVDGAGHIYVADSRNHTIRKITPAGVVSTFAGTAGSPGRADGIGAAARFRSPSGVAVDGAGNVYVADYGNHTIRKITSAGVVSTLAGNVGGISGGLDGIGTGAFFNFPSGVAIDGADNVYVADYGNHTIRKITPGGVVTTLAGTAGSFGSDDGTGAAARFYSPSGVAVDGTGTVYVADYDNLVIRKITPVGVVSTLAGTARTVGSADGTGAAARFSLPSGIAVDGAGHVYVADYGNHTIRKITPDGVVSTLAGTAGSSGSVDSAGAAARFKLPRGVAVDSAGHIYVADFGNHTIRKITPAGVVSSLAGLGGSGSDDGPGAAARFNNPFGVAVDSAGNAYVADYDNYTVRKITPAGVVSTLAGAAGSFGSANGAGPAARFNRLRGVAIDSAGNVYVADTNNHTIRKITPDGVVSTFAGAAGSRGGADGTGAAARFSAPFGVAVDGAGNVYVGDSDNHTIRKITPAGVVSTLAGTAGSDGSTDGTGAAARFNYPEGVAVDGAGNVYVADSSNHTIRKITSAGVVSTLAGTADFLGGSVDGTGAAARFNFPSGVAVDGAGNVYVTDADNHTIRKVTASGVVTTVLGVAGQGGVRLGSEARLGFPYGIAVLGSDRLVISSGNAVLIMTLP